MNIVNLLNIIPYNYYMKYALCLRGISYLENFPHDYSCEPFTVDFSHSIPFFKDNIIKALEEQGHEVDVYFCTYPSSKLEYFKQEMNPIAVELGTYQYASPGTTGSLYNGILNVFNLVKESKRSYDYIICSRFDNVVFEKITNVYIPENSLTTVTPRDDFFIFSVNLFDRLIASFTEFRDQNLMFHNYTSVLSSRGIRCHTMYSHVYIGRRYPFFKTARQFFTKKNHLYHLCDVNDIYNPRSKFYSFFYKANTDYTPYIDPNITIQDPANHIPELEYDD